MSAKLALPPPRPAALLFFYPRPNSWQTYTFSYKVNILGYRFFPILTKFPKNPIRFHSCRHFSLIAHEKIATPALKNSFSSIAT